MSRVQIPILTTLERIPGGLMLVPLVLGSIIGTFFPGFLDIGNFTTALLRDGALPLIALLILATGAQVTFTESGAVLGHAGTVLLGKTIIPGLGVVAIGQFVGLDGIAGLSLVAILAAFENQNGGLWLALTGQYGDERDRGAYVAAALNDGPFFTLILLGLSGLGDIPLTAIVAAIIPFVIGLVWGNFDERFREVMKPVPAITIPFFAFALGAGIDLIDVAEGGLGGIGLGLLVTPITGSLVYLGYRFILRKGIRSGVGFAAGTTAGNAVATPAVVAQADPAFEQYVSIATAQIGASVLVTALFAPFLTHLALRKHLAEVTAADDAAVKETTTEEERDRQTDFPEGSSDSGSQSPRGPRDSDASS